VISLTACNLYLWLRASENDLEPFKKFVAVVTDELRQQAHIVSQVFPTKVDVFYAFADRVFEDVVRSAAVNRPNQDG
jgi:hypothetical protein